MKHTGYSLPVAPTQASAAPSQDIAAVYSPRQQGLGLISAVKCYNERHEDLVPAFWYFFPAKTTPLPAAAPTAPTAPSTSSAALPTPQVKACAFGLCQLVKLPCLCPNQLCKRHCLEAGACAVHASPAPLPLTRKALPPLSGPSLEALSAVTQYTARIPQHVERTAREKRERYREHAAEPIRPKQWTCLALPFPRCHLQRRQQYRRHLRSRRRLVTINSTPIPRISIRTIPQSSPQYRLHTRIPNTALYCLLTLVFSVSVWYRYDDLSDLYCGPTK
ncbi:hypothetical protein B0H14DRAFT_3562325 [Mycena olivaceomarginata]|nr:hypothetical protein B0H14DRAFT_3562325 [Mycena olivaceomarginata]